MATDTCPNCGAVRFRWMGGSHYGVTILGEYHTLRCLDGKTPDQVWMNWMRVQMGARWRPPSVRANTGSWPVS